MDGGKILLPISFNNTCWTTSLISRPLLLHMFAADTS